MIYYIKYRNYVKIYYRDLDNFYESQWISKTTNLTEFLKYSYKIDEERFKLKTENLPNVPEKDNVKSIFVLQELIG